MAFISHHLSVLEAKFVSVTLAGNVSLRSCSFNLEATLHFFSLSLLSALDTTLHLIG